jgi:hypothetical protein
MPKAASESQGAGVFEAVRERMNALALGCPFRVDFPGEGILCFEPLGRTLQPPPEDAAESFCRRDPLNCPVCQASLESLRQKLLLRYN